MEVAGQVTRVVLRGQVVFENGRVLADPGVRPLTAIKRAYELANST